MAKGFRFTCKAFSYEKQGRRYAKGQVIDLPADSPRLKDFLSNPAFDRKEIELGAPMPSTSHAELKDQTGPVRRTVQEFEDHYIEMMKVMEEAAAVPVPVIKEVMDFWSMSANKDMAVDLAEIARLHERLAQLPKKQPGDKPPAPIEGESEQSTEIESGFDALPEDLKTLLAKEKITTGAQVLELGVDGLMAIKGIGEARAKKIVEICKAE